MVIFADDAAPLRRRVRKPTRVPYDQISRPEEHRSFECWKNQLTSDINSVGPYTPSRPRALTPRFGGEPTSLQSHPPSSAASRRVRRTLLPCSVEMASSCVATSRREYLPPVSTKKKKIFAPPPAYGSIKQVQGSIPGPRENGTQFRGGRPACFAFARAPSAFPLPSPPPSIRTSR